MIGVGKWIVGIVAGLIGLAGLLVASHMEGHAFYWGGLIVFAASVLFNYALVVRYAGREDKPSH